MSGGNGVDLGHVAAMLEQVLLGQAEQGRRLDRLEAELRSLRTEMTSLQAGVTSFQTEMRSFQTEMRAFQAEVKAELGDMRAEIAGLRQTVVEYHSAVIGHGVLISELDSRLRRVEQHLGLPSLAG